MNRKEFMQKLEFLLRNISAEERQEALQYYEDYFDDAGIEEEQKVISELISPEHVAHTILDGLQGGQSKGEYTEKGYQNTQYRDYQSMTPQQHQHQHQHQQQNQKQSRQPMNHSQKILLIILLVLALPIYGGFLVGAAGTFLGIVVAVIAVTVSLLIAGIALVGAGIALFVTFEIAKACILCGVGLILIAVGIPCLLVTIWLCTKVMPSGCKFIIRSIRKLLGNGGVIA